MAHLKELATGEQRPVIVMLTCPPPAKMPQGKRLRLVGLFYKLVTLPEDESTGGNAAVTHEYPVIVTGALTRRSVVGGGGFDLPPAIIAMFALVLALLVAFMLLRKRISAQKAAAKNRYEPLRFEDAVDAVDAVASVDDERDDGPVDEELLRQLEEFQQRTRRTGESDDADHQNGSR